MGHVTQAEPELVLGLQLKHPDNTETHEGEMCPRQSKGHSEGLGLGMKHWGDSAGIPGLHILLNLIVRISVTHRPF